MPKYVKTSIPIVQPVNVGVGDLSLAWSDSPIWIAPVSCFATATCLAIGDDPNIKVLIDSVVVGYLASYNTKSGTDICIIRTLAT